MHVDVESVFGWSKSDILTLAINPDIRSARFYGQFSLDETWTLLRGGDVSSNVSFDLCYRLKKNGDHNSSSGVKVSCGFDIKELDMCIYFILQRSAKILFLGCDVV